MIIIIFTLFYFIFIYFFIYFYFILFYLSIYLILFYFILFIYLFIFFFFGGGLEMLIFKRFCRRILSRKENMPRKFIVCLWNNAIFTACAAVRCLNQGWLISHVTLGDKRKIYMIQIFKHTMKWEAFAYVVCEMYSWLFDPASMWQWIASETDEYEWTTVNNHRGRSFFLWLELPPRRIIILSTATQTSCIIEARKRMGLYIVLE